MEKFPQIIKDVPQWAVCGFHPGTTAEKQPYVWDNDLGDMIPLRKDGTAKGPANLHLLMSFKDAERCVRYYNELGHHLMLGFYLMPSDPFCCIDMDIKDTMTDEERETAAARYAKIVELFHSYTEVSRSGNGLHLWVYGLPQEGKRRDGVEVYSQYRYIICTGNHWNATPLQVAGEPGTESHAYIADMIEMLRSEMNSVSEFSDFKMIEYTQEDFENDPYSIPDMDVYVQLSEQSNGALFKQVWDARWRVEEIHAEEGERAYTSQSEAELTLIDMLCFKTKYNDQVRRMFMMSKLGDRYDDNRRAPGDKIKQSYHLERMIRRRRFEEARNAMEVQAIMQANIERTIANREKMLAATTPEKPAAEFRSTDGKFTEEQSDGLQWPPGMMGELARYIYNDSLLPVKDISVLAALSLMSGVCGKAWTTPTNGGLNNYFVLVGKSGIGKEGYKGGMQRVLRQVELRGGRDGQQIFGASNFVTNTQFASKQALIKGVTVQPGNMDRMSFLHYMEEVGGFFADLSMGKGKAPELANVMLSLYNSSTFNSYFDGMEYSNKENNTVGGSISAYSFAGETTPTEFYNHITDSMMASGFMSRIIVWECEQERPLQNKNHTIDMPDMLMRGVGEVIVTACKQHADGTPIAVRFSPEAQERYDQMDVYVNSKLANEENEVIRQAYNRFVFKALKLGCLLSIFENCYNPILTVEQFDWALEFVETCNNKIIQKYKSGEVGAGGDVQCRVITLDRIRTLIDKRNGRDQRMMAWMWEHCILSRSDIQVNLHNKPAFRNSKLGFQNAFDKALFDLTQLGVVRPLNPNEHTAEFITPKGRPYLGKCYRINVDMLDIELDKMH